MTRNYLKRFVDLKCAGDVLNAAAPINSAAKEITEAMGAVVRLRPFFLEPQYKMQADLVDCCAGNALGSILAVHLLPIRNAYAIDTNPRTREGHKSVKRWSYWQKDISDLGMYKVITVPFAVLAIHPCGDLAWKVVEIYRTIENAKALVLIPCCNPRKDAKYLFISHPALKRKLSTYEQFALDLATRAKGRLHRDRQIESEKNLVIVARKEG